MKHTALASGRWNMGTPADYLLHVYAVAAVDPGGDEALVGGIASLKP